MNMQPFRFDLVPAIQINQTNVAKATEKGTQPTPDPNRGRETGKVRFACFVAVIAVIIFGTAAPAARGGESVPGMLSGRVVRVADGDTLTLRDGHGERIIVRLAEIDAPEHCQPFNQRSRASLTELTLNRRITVKVLDIDRYGRSVGRVTVEGESETVNRIQLRRGLAWFYARYARDKSLRLLEREAARAKLGLWAEKSPTPPWDWRRQHPRGTRCPAVAGS
ncbi:MAG: thermonuclease family protein [Azoarcus sp.]|jgi:endonuclease YncB( thermonuclease family)|nr:thermonuclease family protein [Azoarcus sp.]